MKWLIRIRTLERETLGSRTSEGIDTIETLEKPIYALEGLWIAQGDGSYVLFPWWRVLEVIEKKGE